VWHPDCLHPRYERKLKFCNSEFGVVERHDSNPHQPRIVGDKIAHRSIVCARCSVPQIISKLSTHRKRGGYAVGSEHQLFLKAEHVHCYRTIITVECTEGLNFFRLGNQRIAKCDLSFDMCWAVLRTVGDNRIRLIVSDQ